VHVDVGRAKGRRNGRRGIAIVLFRPLRQQYDALRVLDFECVALAIFDDQKRDVNEDDQADRH
jgi:hypothetical protein